MKNTLGNDLVISLTQAVEEMKTAYNGKINLAELERRTGITRQRLRTLQAKGFYMAQSTKPRTVSKVMDGFESISNDLLKKGVTNSRVHLSRLKEYGFAGGQTSVKRYIAAHRDLVPSPRQLADPQGPRRNRYETGPGEAFQLDWGFAEVQCLDGGICHLACLAMICHHCGRFFVEFFPNAKQENLFIGMLHGFACMGIPHCILTDNMKSVVIRRDSQGHPVWQKDYESFMRAIGFSTRLCKPRHPYTKGKVERLIRFVKDNFLAGRSFWNVTDLNESVLRWCDEMNSSYRASAEDVPVRIHASKCMSVAHALEENPDLLLYLCPERRISYDGFVTYEGRRFGVPLRYRGNKVRVSRDGHVLRIYTPNLKEMLVSHEVTWSRIDRYCADQFLVQPEEFPTAPVKARIQMVKPRAIEEGFGKFDFSGEEHDE